MGTPGPGLLTCNVQGGADVRVVVTMMAFPVRGEHHPTSRVAPGGGTPGPSGNLYFAGGAFFFGKFARESQLLLHRKPKPTKTILRGRRMRFFAQPPTDAVASAQAQL